MKTLNTTLTESTLTSLYESILSGSDTIVATATDTVEKNTEVWNRIYDCLTRHIPASVQFNTAEHSRSLAISACRDAINELNGMKTILSEIKLYSHLVDGDLLITDKPSYDSHGDIYFKISCNSYFDTLYLRITDKWMQLVEKILGSQLVSKSLKIHNVA